jgi:sirohydrochlorin ferrochelatase
MNSGPETGGVALVLVDHGSRSEAANRSLEEVAREVGRLAAGRYVAVLPAHMDIASPTIAEAFDAAVAAGARTVVVVLYFLAPGRHSETDVPRLVAEAAARHPGVGFTVSPSLGPHAALASLVLEKAADALAGAQKA